jgi:hypothetical protein
LGRLFLIFFVIGIAGLVFWIWALVDAIKVPDDSMYRTGAKMMWVLVIVLAGWIGAIIYLLVGRPDRNAAPPPYPPAGGGMPPPPLPY